MNLYLVTDPGDPEWNALVEMTETQAAEVEAGEYEVEVIDRANATSFEAFSAEFLDA